MKKISIVSTTPTHPINAGNRARIVNLVQEYKKSGFDVHFVFLCMGEEYDERSMKLFFGENLTILKKRSLIPLKNLPTKILGRVHFELQKLLKVHVNYYLDFLYPFKFHNDLLKTLKNLEPDVIQVEYVHLSYILKSFPNSIKVIDTHDVFTNRNKRLSIPNYSWISFTKKQERKGIERANFALAITNAEADFLTSLKTNCRILTVGHFIHPSKVVEVNSTHTRIGFLGPNTHINQATINTLVPIMRESAITKEFSFVFAGAISNYVKTLNVPRIKYLETPQLEDFYQEIDILYNPTINTTGLKIKNVEALFFNKQLLTSIDGAQGIEGGAGKYFFCKDDFSSISDCLQQIKSSPKKNQSLFIKGEMDKWRENLLSIFRF